MGGDVSEAVYWNGPYGPYTHKHCTRCGRWLPLDAFSRTEYTSFGWSARCKECAAVATQEWRERNPEYIADYNEARRIPPTKLTCVECGSQFEGRRDRLVCSRKCRDSRYRKLHPLEYAAKRARKDARRRATESA